VRRVEEGEADEVLVGGEEEAHGNEAQQTQQSEQLYMYTTLRMERLEDEADEVLVEGEEEAHGNKAQQAQQPEQLYMYTAWRMERLEDGKTGG